MTDIPIAEQIAAVREFTTSLNARYYPRIVNAVLVTLQQHGRAMADLEAAKCVLEDEQDAHQETLLLWREAKLKNERLEAELKRTMTVVEAARKVAPVYESAMLENALAAFDAGERVSDTQEEEPER